MTTRTASQETGTSPARGAVSLYHQIYLTLREQILSGQRPHGSRMPTEAEVSEIYNVSRITARRALDELAAQNLVERKRRIGTHVIHKSVSKPIEANVDQAVDSLLAWGRNTEVRSAEVGEDFANEAVAEALRLPLGSAVIKAVKTRWLEDEPLGHIVSYLPPDLGLNISRETLKATPTLQVLQRAGIHIGYASQIITAAAADAGLSQALGIAMMAPVMRITRTVYADGGKPILLTIAQYRSDRYHIRLNMGSDSNQVSMS